MTRLVILLVGSLLLLGGCGDDESNDAGRDISGKLGGAGEKDTERLGEYLRTVQPLPTTDIAIVKAFNDEDLEAAKKGVDKLDKIATDSREIATGFEGEKIRNFTLTYSERVADVADAYQQIIDAPADATVKELGRDLIDAKTKLKAQDDKFLATLKDVLPRDQYDKITERIEKLNEEFESAAGG